MDINWTHLCQIDKVTQQNNLISSTIFLYNILLSTIQKHFCNIIFLTSPRATCLNFTFNLHFTMSRFTIWDFYSMLQLNSNICSFFHINAYNLKTKTLIKLWLWTVFCTDHFIKWLEMWFTLITIFISIIGIVYWYQVL